MCAVTFNQKSSLGARALTRGDCTFLYTGVIIFPSRSYQTSGYPFISLVMYAVYASIVLQRSRFIPLKSMGEGRSDIGDAHILYTS